MQVANGKDSVPLSESWKNGRAPYPYPSPTRDRRSWAFLWPVDHPKTPWIGRQPAFDPCVECQQVGGGLSLCDEAAPRPAGFRQCSLRTRRFHSRSRKSGQVGSLICLDDMASQQSSQGGLPGTLAKRLRGCGSPAIQVRFSRSHGTIQQSPIRRQKTQIVQSCKTLDDFLPGF